MFVSFYCEKVNVSSCPPPAGGSEAIRARWPAVRRVPGNSLRWQVRAVLLRQRHLSAVLLRVLLGGHPLPRRARVSQAPGEGGRRPAASHLLPLELSRTTPKTGGRGGQVVQESQIIVQINALFCCWFLFALMSPNIVIIIIIILFENFYLKLIYISIFWR